MADNAIFLIVANILALFDIRPQGDAVNGKASLENVEFQRRLVRCVRMNTHHVCS